MSFVLKPSPHQVTVQESIKDPVLPLVDSHAQNLIQKRITVEKLSSWCVSVCPLFLGCGTRSLINFFSWFFFNSCEGPVNLTAAQFDMAAHNHDFHDQFILILCSLVLWLCCAASETL